VGIVIVGAFVSVTLRLLSTGIMWGIGTLFDLWFSWIMFLFVLIGGGVEELVDILRVCSEATESMRRSGNKSELRISL